MSNGTQTEVLRLPTLDDSAIPSFGFAQRALSIVLLTVATLLLGALAASFVVQMSLTVLADGVTEQREVWPVRPQQSGVVSAVLVKTGDTVRRGQTMALLDTLESSDALRISQSQLQGEQLELARARQTLPLNVQLQTEKIAEAAARLLRARAVLREAVVDWARGGSIDSVLSAYVPGTRTRIDAPLADVRQAESAERTARVALEVARLEAGDLDRRESGLLKLRGDVEHSRQRVARGRILSPADGIVLTDQLQRLIGTQVQTGEQLLEVADGLGWRAVLSVREHDVHDVRVDQGVTLELPNLKLLDGRRIRARVLSVAQQPMSGASAIPGAELMYRVVVAFDPNDFPTLGDELRRGYLVRARIVTRRDRIASLVIGYLRDRLHVS